MKKLVFIFSILLFLAVAGNIEKDQLTGLTEQTSAVALATYTGLV